MRNLTETEKLIGRQVKQALFACRDAICANYPTAQIVLYGSRARGQMGPESDFDLLVLLDEEVTFAKKRMIQDALYEVGLAEDIVISTIVRSCDAWNSPISQAMPLYKVIQEEGLRVA